MLRGQVFELADADAMLAAAGAAELQRALDQPLARGASRRRTPSGRRVQHDDQMEVAVAGMADERRDDVGVLAGRPASRGCTRPGERSARRCPWSTRARQAATPPSRSRRYAAPARACSRSSSDEAHLKPLRAMLARDLLDGANLILDTALADAVELEEQRRRERIVGLRVARSRRCSCASSMISMRATGMPS